MTDSQTDIKPDSEVLQDILNIVAMADDQAIAYARILTTLVNSGRIRTWRDAVELERNDADPLTGISTYWKGHTGRLIS